MLSFKEFITEKDPFLALHRLNKRRGVDSDNIETLPDKSEEKVKTRNIPLKGYEPDEDFDNELSDIYVKKVYKQKMPAKTKTFNVRELTPTQSTVRIDDLHRLQHKIYGNTPSIIKIATYKGKNYIMDGHHAIFGARLRGEKEITADHYELD